MIRKAYSIFYSEYGRQGWWPLSGEPRNNSCEKGKGKHTPKHHNGRPVSDDDRFEIMVGAILTQNTAWTNVEKAITQLNASGISTPARILSSKKEKVANLIRSAGYYNQKSERLAIISEFVRQNRFSNLIATDTPNLRQMLLDVKGIGPETADSIVLYAFEKPSFVIDAYTKRIFSRMGVCRKDEEYHALQSLFVSAMRKDVNAYKEYHALIVEHAKRHCRTKPICTGCPISRLCQQKL